VPGHILYFIYPVNIEGERKNMCEKCNKGKYYITISLKLVFGKNCKKIKLTENSGGIP